MLEDDFDNIPDDFADLSGVDWDQILAGDPPATTTTSISTTAPTTTTSAAERSSTPSSSNDSFGDQFGDIDASFLNELNLLEQTLVHDQNRSAPAPVPSRISVANSERRPGHSTTSSSVHAPNGSVAGSSTSRPSNVPSNDGHSPYFTTLNSNSHKRKEVTSTSSSKVDACPPKKACLTPPSNGKGKAKEDPAVLHNILNIYDDELMCPICCDLFVATHVGNPCGHSYCGDCGSQWHAKSKGCPTCRTVLNETLPMIPNILLDNLVEKHIKALVLSGNADWDAEGSKYREWDAKRRAWKKKQLERDKAKAGAGKRRRINIPYVTLELFEPENGMFLVQNDDPTDQNWVAEDDDIQLIPRPIRRRRARRVVNPPS